MKMEYADMGHERRRGRAMVDAMRQLKALGAPCSLYRHHGTATRVLEIDGELRAVCKTCARSLSLDRQIMRQKEARAAMRGR